MDQIFQCNPPYCLPSQFIARAPNAAREIIPYIYILESLLSHAVVIPYEIQRFALYNLPGPCGAMLPNVLEHTNQGERRLL
jgi:hypothetical protein